MKLKKGAWRNQKSMMQRWDGMRNQITRTRRRAKTQNRQRLKTPQTNPCSQISQNIVHDDDATTMIPGPHQEVDH